MNQEFKVGLVLTNINSGLVESEVCKMKKKPRHDLGEAKLVFQVLLNQTLSIFFVLLLVSAGLSFYLGEYIDSIIFLSINIVNVLFGFVQEYRASRASALLAQLISHSVSVVRDGAMVEIDSGELVLGDIVLLIPGDVVSADIIVREGYNIYVDESVLTGESLPVQKKIGDNILAGTSLVAGKVTGQVVGTPDDSSLTKYGKKIEETSKHNSFSQFIGRVSLGILLVTLVSLCLIVVTSVLFTTKYTISEFSLFSISMLVGVVPESLPLIITFMLSREALALAKSGVLVKRLSALQQLGSMKYLLTDKTGTITENKPKAVESYPVGDLDFLVTKIAWSQYERNPMDTALDNAINSFYNKPGDYNSDTPTISSFTGSTGYGMFLFLSKEGIGSRIIIRGQYTPIISICKNISKELRISLDAKYQEYESKGLRVIAIASRISNESVDIDKEHLNASAVYEFGGLIVLEDPLKVDAVHSYKAMNGLGVTVKILTGDSPLVARHTAGELDKSLSDNAVCSLDTTEVNTLSENDIDEDLIYARCKPDQKLLLINRHILKGSVGFMGEGINDALALKKADVGIAVNNASDVARQSADIILTEKSLNPIITAVQMSRRVYEHISTYLLCTLTGNIGTLFSLTIVALFWTDLPMLPVQILLNNLLTDVPLILLITDHVSRSQYGKPISHSANSFFKKIVIFGLVSTLFDMFYFYIAHTEGLSTLRTGWFLFSVFAELILVLTLRSKESLLKSPKMSRPLGYALSLSAVAAIAFVYVPSLASLFDLVPLSIQGVSVIVVITLVYLFCNEVCKYIFNKYNDLVQNKKAILNNSGGNVSLYTLFFAFISIGLLVVISASYYLGPKNTPDNVVTAKITPEEQSLNKVEDVNVSDTRFKYLKIGKVDIKLEVADTNELRQKGLGGRKTLDEFGGMIFIFDSVGKHGFWMKDTLLPLDIIWLDNKMNVVSIKNNLSPASFPNVFYPSRDALYVIELRGGVAQKLKIKIGDKLNLSE